MNNIKKKILTKLRTLPLFQQNTQTECVRHWIYTKSGFRFVYAKYMSGFFPSLYCPLFVRNVRFIEYINKWQKHWCLAAVVVVVWGYMSSWIECASTLVHWVGLESDRFREKCSYSRMFKFFLHFYLNYHWLSNFIGNSQTFSHEINFHSEIRQKINFGLKLAVVQLNNQQMALVSICFACRKKRQMFCVKLVTFTVLSFCLTQSCFGIG